MMYSPQLRTEFDEFSVVCVNGLNGIIVSPGSMTKMNLNTKWINLNNKIPRNIYLNPYHNL